MRMMTEAVPMESLISRLKWKFQTSYGHIRPVATKCGHVLHPSAPQHMPLCPSCVASGVKSKMEVALKELIAGGGPNPPAEYRDRPWLQAKLHYEVAQKRQAAARLRDQLRSEREQVWEEAHARYDSQRQQAAVTFQLAAECPVCALLSAPYPTNMPEALMNTEIIWWEKPGALVTNEDLVSRPLSLGALKYRQRSREKIGSPTFRRLIRASRNELLAEQTHQKSWEIRYRTEIAVRRKHNLGDDFQTNAAFWGSPICGLESRRHHDSVLEDRRMSERRARGYRLRPKPPRSSLSYSESSADLDVDESMLEKMRREEELEEQQREARKVGEEVGYLYFVGEVDGMIEWREDYLRSDRHFVYRANSPSIASVRSMSVTFASGDEDDEDEDDDYELDKMDLE